MPVNQAEIELKILVERCGCTRKSLRITPAEAEEMNREFESKDTANEVRPVAPSCTPEKCFPTLFSFAYGAKVTFGELLSEYKMRMGWGVSEQFRKRRFIEVKETVK